MARVMDLTISEVHIQMPGLDSDHCRRPLLHLLDDTKESREQYMKVGVPLHKSALKGNWEDAKSKLVGDGNDLVRTAITKGWATALHVAAGANRVHFVQELVKLMQSEDLELQDRNGNTAFFLAAGVGNPRLAQIMMQKNPALPIIRGQMGFTPLHFAVIQGRTEMAWFLYYATIRIFEEEDWDNLFLFGVNAGMSDFALGILEDKPWLAKARDKNRDTALHLLARKKLTKSVIKQTQVLQLVRQLWTIILTTIDSESSMREIINNPSPLIFDAVLIGNFEFLAELLSIYPDLIWEKDYKGRSIMHFAVEQRHARIFNLIHEIGSMKDLIASSLDDDSNTILHLAAKLAPPDQLNLVSGAAFQLTLELIWFKEVKKIMLPSNVETCNLEGLTPSELFTKEHVTLHSQAEKWMKGTANSCLLVSSLIVAGIISATFSLPGGNNNITEIPNYFKKSAFMVFYISNAIAFVSSTASIIIFLSILLSRYGLSDFYMSLPLKLIFGIITQFMSITSIVVTFSSALITRYYLGIKLVPSLIFVLAFLIIPLFGFLQFPLLSRILYSIYFCRRSLVQPNRAYDLLE